MSHHLVITAIGTDRPGISNEFIHLVTQMGCNVIDSRIAMFGNEFTIIMLLSGTANAISKVESTLPIMGQDSDTITMMKRTSPHTELNYEYSAEAIIESDDRPGITEQITHFFATKNIDISSLSAKTMLDEESNLDKFHMQLAVRLDDSCNLMQLQEEFEAHCLKLKVKSSINFIKH
ncbi:glycine cleavage system protein R [Aliivibrio kagoshimensis]|uniref:glycine cleavage system protein R n=1 Tax=Aliivibrio kagoshimensis TaxID=2910230 RepID=UPI003D13B687